MRRLGLCTFALVVACGAFEAGSTVQPPAPTADGGPSAEGGTSSGGSAPVDDAGTDADATSPGTTPRIVQQTSDLGSSTGTGGSLPMSFTSVVAADDLVIVSIVDMAGTSASIKNVEDSNGHKLTPVVQAVNGESASAGIWWYKSQGGPTTVTITTGALNTRLAIWMFEAAGVSSLVADPQRAIAQPATNGIAAAPLVSVTAPPALVVSTIAHGSDVGAIAAGNDFTKLDLDTTSPITFGTAYRVVSQPDDYGAIWMADSGVDFNACTAAFKP